jgi:prolyl-tRNA synthetase
MSSAYSNVVDLLSKLSITPKTVEHEHVADNKSWDAALEKIQAGVSFKLSKTLVLKPKTAKSAAPTPLVILALDSTETNITAISKSIGLKDCRFASEDLLKETFDEDKTSGNRVNHLIYEIDHACGFLIGLVYGFVQFLRSLFPM